MDQEPRYWVVGARASEVKMGSHSKYEFVYVLSCIYTCTHTHSFITCCSCMGKYYQTFRFLKSGLASWRSGLQQEWISYWFGKKGM